MSRKTYPLNFIYWYSEVVNYLVFDTNLKGMIMINFLLLNPTTIILYTILKVVKARYQTA